MAFLAWLAAYLAAISLALRGARSGPGRSRGAAMAMVGWAVLIVLPVAVAVSVEGDRWEFAAFVSALCVGGLPWPWTTAQRWRAAHPVAGSGIRLAMAMVVLASTASSPERVVVFMVPLVLACGLTAVLDDRVRNEGIRRALARRAHPESA